MSITLSQREPTSAANIADFTIEFDAGDLPKPPGLISVLRFGGIEEISRLFSFRVEMCSHDDQIDTRRMVGRAATLVVAGARAAPQPDAFTVEEGDSLGSRFVHGIVRSFERTGAGSSLTYYACEIVPRHWLLTRRHRSRIFQKHNCPDMSVPGIIQKVLDETPMGDCLLVFDPQRQREEREYVVQYRESDWDFLSRMMEQEGFYYFFQHAPQGVTLIITDGSFLARQRELPYRERSGLVREREFVYDFKLHDQIHYGSVSLDDFDFKRPSVDLAVRTNRFNDFSGLEFTEFPGDYADRTVGERYAQLRLDAFQAQRCVRTIRTTARDLRLADRLQVADAPVEQLDQKLVLTRLEHRGAQPQSAEDEMVAGGPAEYEAIVAAIPDHPAFQYRPPPKTPRPVIPGTQTAIVVGPRNEEIFTDAYGRVKVQFHWDPDQRFDEHSSCFIRVSQGMAGGMYGAMFLPRVGQEVIVSFLDGDPDRPIITGRVFNNDHMPPYQLPAEKTRSCIKTHSTPGGGGCNEIRFEDAKSREQFLIQAERRMDTRVKADHLHTVGGNYNLSVGSDAAGGDSRELVHGAKDVQIRHDLNTGVDGNEFRHVAGHSHIRVEGHQDYAVFGDLLLNARNQLHGVKDNYEVNANAIKLKANTLLVLECGASSLVLTPSGIYIQGGPRVLINSGVGPNFTWLPQRGPAPTRPADPAIAEKTDPGRDFRYLPAGAAQTADPQADTAQHHDLDREQRVSWIELEMVDEDGQPWPNEPFEVALPDGRVRRGTLDQDGRAHLDLPEPGQCQVCFPNLDSAAWERV